MAADTPTSTSGAPSRDTSAAGNITSSTARPIEEFLDRLGPDAVFGKAVESDGITVIPVAEVRTGFGFGFGEGRNRIDEATDDHEGGGGGGGAGARITPRGYIRISNGEVKYEPIVDIRTLALAGLALTGWLAYIFAD